MTTDSRRITVGGVAVEVVRKDIKNLHLGVYPPHGRVRVAAPLRVQDETIRLAIIDKLGWIKRQRAQFEAQPRQSQREMVNGESHYFMGRRYRLRIHERDAPALVALRGIASMDLFVRPGSTAAQREDVLKRWYRQQLRELIPALIDKWQPLVGVRLAGWGVKQMKTKWGSCNPATGRIWLNLELAKKSAACIEYIVVHEVLHLRLRYHDEEFVRVMDRLLPTWRNLRTELNRAPLAHSEW